MACRDVVHEIVTIFDIATIDRDEYIAGLNTCLCRASIGSNDTNNYSVREPINATDRRGLCSLELNTDGAADDFMLRSNEHVVDVRDDVGGHGEANALRA